MCAEVERGADQPILSETVVGSELRFAGAAKFSQ